MIGLWDTNGGAVVKALAAERRSAGGLTSGLALSLVAVVEEHQVRTAEAAATIAAAAHPCRLLIVVRSEVTHERSRLDAEIVVGGRLGPCEAVVMRMRGRLALHAESVVMPLLAPDVPVVTWWHGCPPEKIAYDPLGVVADRRITDCAQTPDALAALRQRAEDYAPGDTDLGWTRITPWRTLVASAFDAAPAARVDAVELTGPEADPSTILLGGWLQSRLGVKPTVTPAGTKELESVTVRLSSDDTIGLIRTGDGTATLRRTGLAERTLPLVQRPLGEELAEELRRLDPDQPYAAALSAAYGLTGLQDRAATRVHVWHDPALSERPEPAAAGRA